MARSIFRSRTILLLPLVLLVVVLVEEIVWAEIREHIGSVYLRVAARMALNGAVFAFAARRVEPWLRATLQSARTHSRRHIGWKGPLAFYLVAYGALYAAFYVLETKGPKALLP